jgi:hypothetical protein
MSRTLQTTWAKLSLSARARFPRTAEEERQDALWVAHDEAIRVAAEGVEKKEEDAEQMEGPRLAGIRPTTAGTRPRRRGPTPPPRRRRTPS